jgi:hypothetical protein
MGMPMPGELADEGDALRADAQRRIAAGEWLADPDGHYSFPIVLGIAYTRNRRMEILAYRPSAHG